MVDAISQMPERLQFTLALMAIVFSAGVIISLATQVRKYARHRHEITLKRELVERGLSIDEIERVVSAGKSAN